MKKFSPLVVLLAVLAGFVSTAQPAMLPEATNEVMLQTNDCLTVDQRRDKNLSILSQAEKHNYTLTQVGRLIQAGIFAGPKTGVKSYVVGTAPKTSAVQPPQVEDPGSGGYPTYSGQPIYYQGVLFPFGIYILMGCPGGGEAYTGSPPGDRQVGFGVHGDGSISNPAITGCPGAAYSNCLYVWLDAGSSTGSYLHYFWIAGRYTEPMHNPGWAWCFS